MNESQAQAIGPGYAHAQLARALTTASDHEDAATRRRAEERVRRWQAVMDGMARGTLAIGSRTPVAGLPAWVTPLVVRGGFATGEAAAAGPLTPDEVARLGGAGADGSADRRALFRYFLTEAGLAELGELLDSGAYDVTVPEEAALLTVAWLLRAGDRAAALRLLEEITPFADRLRFTPRPNPTPRSDGSMVHRETVGDVRGALADRRRNLGIERMNEALTVWNPFADELLAHWLETVRDGRVGAAEPDGWARRSEELLVRYRELAAAHTLCGKHRKPKENLAILRSSLEATAMGGELPPRQRGLLQHAVDSMVARRGTPGSTRFTALRERQAADASHATLYELARVLIARLASVPADAALPSTDWLLDPVTPAESHDSGVAAGSTFPTALRQVVERALSAPVTELVERGVVPSAEVLAELVPQLVATTTALAYEDDALRTLMAAVYRAFANRRSLLLVDLAHRVRLDELPWVQAVDAYRRKSKGTAGHARAALTDLGELTLRAFPGTILPNPMIQELGALARQSALDVPFTEELAADIFMGTFSGKFLRAAQEAADLLEGSLYARYYAIDYAAIRAIDDTARRRGLHAATSRTFAALCAERAGDRSGPSWVAGNGMVIEQAQILTTHNLAALVHPIGVDPAQGWGELSRGAFSVACRLVGRIAGNPRPLATIKDAAYAWRQAVFFLSLCGLEDQFAVTVWMQEKARRAPEHTSRRLAPVLAGLRHVIAGGSLDDGRTPGVVRFLGWSTDRHWMRAV